MIESSPDVRDRSMPYFIWHPKFELNPILQQLLFIPLIFTAFTFSSQLCQAVSTDKKTPAQATLDLEWEAVEDAAGYEIELTPKSGGKVLRFTAEKNEISQLIPVGVYILRIHSREASTGMYGPWSEPTQVDVVAKKIELIEPSNEAELQIEKGNTLAVEFKWSAATGAKGYTLKIWEDQQPQVNADSQLDKKSGSESGGLSNAKVKPVLREYKTSQTSHIVRLSALKSYRWSVTFESEQAVNYSTEAKPRTFVILGAELAKPVLNKIEPPKVTEVSWSTVLDAESYEVAILWRALDETDWKPLRENTEVKTNSWQFEKLAPGAYRIELTAHADFRTSSETTYAEFTVKPTRQELAQALRFALLPKQPIKRTTTGERNSGKKPTQSNE